MAEMRVYVENEITTTPSGTQNVAITGQPISVTTTPSGTQNVAVTGQPISTTLAANPAITGFYGFLLPDTPGVVAANNYVSLFNPVGSGKTLAVASAYVSAYVTGGGSTTKNSFIGSRITTATGGTLQAASAINKGRTSSPNTVGEVRTGNPSVTLGANIIAFPPPIGTDTASASSFVAAGVGQEVYLAPGEGVVFRTAVGDTDENFNVSFQWGEL